MAYFSLIFVLLLLNLVTPSHSAPTSGLGGPFTQSSDVWATVITNIAPLMALVGERHAKEYMRTIKNAPERALLAVVPVGILSILVSAVRLVGTPVLRRLIGRETERKGDAMAELTPVSVETATPVWSAGNVEIDASGNITEKAFLCAHKADIKDFTEAFASFRDLWRPRKQGVSKDCDFELILSTYACKISLKVANFIVDSLDSDGNPEIYFKTLPTDTSTVSFRVCGISPSQTISYGGSYWKLILDVMIAMIFFALMITIQIIGWLQSDTTQKRPNSSLLMGIIGYIGVTISTTALLKLMAKQVSLEIEKLPDVMRTAVWTISNSQHSALKATKAPLGNTLVTVKPVHDFRRKGLLKHITTVCALLLCVSYVVYYLGVRVAPWWVSFSSLLVLWVGVAWRAVRMRTTYAVHSLGEEEHWIGMMRITFTEGIIDTLKHSCVRPSGDVLLIADTPHHSNIRTWSASQDILKVSLELAKRKCKNFTCCVEHVQLNGDYAWTHLIRFRLVVYFPGFVFRASKYLTMTLEDRKSLDHLARTVLQMLHVCLDQEGDVTAYEIPEENRAPISDVMTGPLPFISTKSGPITLRALLQQVPQEYLYQTVLIPAAMLAAAIERFHFSEFGHKPGRGVELIQGRHIDRLSLGTGAEYIQYLERDLDARGVWDGFMEEREGGEGDAMPVAERAAVEDYGLHNVLYDGRSKEPIRQRPALFSGNEAPSPS